MIHPLFFVPMYCYEVQEWSRKKAALYKKIDRKNFEKKGLQEFYTDRQKDGRSYALDFYELFSQELNLFKQESSVQEI
mgnify:CR=1 FL=1